MIDWLSNLKQGSPPDLSLCFAWYEGCGGLGWAATQSGVQETRKFGPRLELLGHQSPPTQAEVRNVSSDAVRSDGLS